MYLRPGCVLEWKGRGGRALAGCGQFCISYFRSSLLVVSHQPLLMAVRPGIFTSCAQAWSLLHKLLFALTERQQHPQW